MENDTKFLNALYSAGVDNWEWYDYTLSNMPENATDEEILNELINNGVDNWNGYDYAIDLYNELYNADKDDTNDKVEEQKPIEVVAELSESDEYLKKIVGNSEFEKIRETFWKRTTHPKEFDKSIKMIKNGGTIIDARKFYVDLVFNV